MWWPQWGGANSRIMAVDAGTKPSLEPRASFGRTDESQVSRSSLAGTGGCGVSRRSVDTGSLACCSFPSPTAGRGSWWQRGQLLCVRGNSLYGGCGGGAVGFGAGWRVLGRMPSCRSEAGQRHPALLVREKELIEWRSFPEASNCSVWRVKSGWSRGGAGQGLGAVSPQDSVSS